jgi:methionyl-tRNA synthetase
LSIVARSCGGAVPDWREAAGRNPEDVEILRRADALVAVAREHMRAFAVHLYITAAFEVVAEANRYFAAAEPWRLAKSDPGRMKLVLFTTLETLRIVGALLQPVMPAAMTKLLDLLAVAPAERRFADIDQGGRATADLDSPKRLKPGARLPAPAPIFPRYVEPDAIAKA